MSEQDRKSLRQEKAAQQADAQSGTDLVVLKQQKFFEEQVRLLRSQLGDILQQFIALNNQLESSAKIAELQVLAQLLPMLGKNRQTDQAVEFAFSLLPHREIAESIKFIMQQEPLPAEADSSDDFGGLLQIEMELRAVAAQQYLLDNTALKNQPDESPEAEALKKPVEDGQSQEQIEQKQLAAEAKLMSLIKQTGQQERQAQAPAGADQIAQLPKEADEPGPEEKPPETEEEQKRRALQQQAIEAAQMLAAKIDKHFLQDETEIKRHLKHSEPTGAAAEAPAKSPPVTSEPAATSPEQSISSLSSMIKLEEAALKTLEHKREEEARHIIEKLEQAARERQHTAQASTPHFDLQNALDQPEVESFIRQGFRLFEQGKYGEVRLHFSAGLPSWEEMLSSSHLTVIEICEKLGLCDFKLGNYAEAEKTLQSVLARRRNLLSPDHPDTASSLHNLGQFYAFKAAFKEARKMLTESLEMRRRMFGDEYPATAQSFHDLALLYMRLGAYSDAGIMLERAFAIRKKLLGDAHVDSVQSKNDMGRLCFLLNKFPTAEKLFAQALNFRKEKLGKDHPDYIETLSYCAEYLHCFARYAEAQPLVEYVLTVRRKLLGERHPETAASLRQLGKLQLDQNRFDEARRNFNLAAYICKTTLGESHPDTASSLQALGRFCWHHGRSANQNELLEAVPLLEKAYEIRKAVFGEQHADTLESMNSLGSLLTSLNNPLAAEPLLRAALKKRKEIFGQNHLSVAESNHALALCLLKQGNRLEAETLLEEEGLVQSRVLGNDNKLVINAREERQQLLLPQV